MSHHPQALNPSPLDPPVIPQANRPPDPPAPKQLPLSWAGSRTRPLRSEAKAKPKDRSDLTLPQILERWGLRVCGGTLKSPYRISTGGETTIDDDLFLVDYVEATVGFERAHPVLRHRYVEGQPLETFRLRLPGEQRSRALIRWGWFDLIRERDQNIPRRILEEFEAELADRMRQSPFRFPSRL